MVSHDSSKLRQLADHCRSVGRALNDQALADEVEMRAIEFEALADQAERQAR